jgi:filamentous hemagglutinin family protein
MRPDRIRVGAWLAWSLAAAPAGAEVTTDTSFGAETVIAPVANEYQILDDYGRYSGSNLFHSFGLFGVEAPMTASFSAEHGTPARIIARVTGGSPSLIHGTLRTVGGAVGADLYLLNPAGVTFGPTARLDVQGSLHLSTAGRLSFENDPGADFVTTSSAPDPPLSIQNPSAFGFLGDAPVGEIIFNRVAGTFSLRPGETFSAVGGAIVLTGANRTALLVPSGRIQLAAVDGEAEVPVDDVGALSGDALAAAASPESVPIQLLRGFNLDVSAPVLSTAPAGRVVIRGGNLVVDASTINAVHRSDSDAAQPAIDVETVRGVDLRSGGLFTTRSQNLGRSGGTTVRAGQLRIDGAGTGIESLARGAGEGGPTFLEVNDLVLTNGGRIFGQSEGDGAGGRIEILADLIDATSGGQILSFANGNGAGGDITIRADRVFVSNLSDAVNPSAITSVVSPGAAGEGGDLTLVVRELEVAHGGGVTTRTEGAGAGGDLTIQEAERVVLHGMDASARRAALTASTTLGSTGSGGNLSVTSNVFEVLDGGQASTSTQAAGDAGSLVITAAERVSVRGSANGPSFISSDSRLVDDALVPPGGAGGDVVIQTQRFEAVDGGRVTASTDGTRNAGVVRITASQVLVAGTDATPERIPSVVQSRSNAEGADGGDGGAIEITAAGDVIVSDLGELASSTVAGGDAGTIDVTAGGSLRLEREASVVALTEGGSTGDGGSVRLTAGEGVFISGQSLVATESLGTGLAGDIAIEAGPRLEVSNSSITTDASGSSGGRITIVADEIVWLKNSLLTTSVAKGAGGGGDISIDPQFVVLDQSSILARSTDGQGGTITIVTGAFFRTPDSELSVKGSVDGTIVIDAPDTDVTSGITTLPSDVLDATALMRTACSAATAEAGSFVVSGRHPGLPVRPDGLLAAFDSADGAAAVARPGQAGEAAARLAVAGPYPANGCSRAREEVL